MTEALPDGLPSADGHAELQLAAERAGATIAFADEEGDLFDRMLYTLLGGGTRPSPLVPQLVALRAAGRRWRSCWSCLSQSIGLACR